MCVCVCVLFSGVYCEKTVGSVMHMVVATTAAQLAGVSVMHEWE